MTSICADIPQQTIKDADTVFAKLGFTFRVQSAVDQIDFDPDPSYAALEQIVDAAEAIQGGVPPECLDLFAGWVGDGASAACDYVECQRSFWEQVADFFLWLAENLLQILDYIVDVIRWLATWLAWLAVTASMLIFTIDLIAMAVPVAGIGLTSIAAILQAPVFEFLGTVGLVAGTIALLMYLINTLIEWLETLVRDQRRKFCGKGLPSLPDWDPGGYPPPIPTGEGE